MSYKAICLAICLLFGMTTQLNLIPDVTNAIIVPSPTNANTGSSVIFRFMFPAATPGAIGPPSLGSSGLSHKQFIGVQFPSSIGTTDLQYDQTSTIPKFSCALSDGT